MNPKVSAILLCYNHEKYIHEALESVYMQDYTDFEIIIRDDASNDRSSEIITEYINTHSPASKNVRVDYVSGTQNLGLINSLNDSLSRSAGEFIALFAGDDISNTERISKSIELISASDVSLLATDAVVINDFGDTISESFYNPNGVDLYKGIGKCNDNYRLINKANYPERFIAIGGFGFMFNKSLLIDYNYQFPKEAGFEDSFLCILAIWGKGILFSYEKMVKYRQHSNNLSRAGLTTNSLISELIIPKIRELHFYESVQKFITRKDLKDDKIYINKIKIREYIICLELSFLQKENISIKLKWLYKLLKLREIKMKSKIKFILFIIFPVLMKKKLNQELFFRINK